MNPTIRVAQTLNRALHGLFERYDRLLLMGQDVLDPYGGAFGVTRGLSTAFPGRVIGTPISENAVLGVAGGLALCGDPVLVEVMFGDFVTLCLDPLINFISKSVSMYGHNIPMRVVLRCPVGGNRGYGPTHSQSLQKHLLGVPHLRLYELSPLHDPRAVIEEALNSGEPAVFFEDKVLYTRPAWLDGEVDDLFDSHAVDPSGTWVRVALDGAGPPDRVLVAPGGLVPRAVAAMRRALLEDELVCELLVPARLYPLPLDPVLPLLADAGQVLVVEDGVAGGGWASDVARLVYDRLWGRLSAPIRLVQPRCAVIPATRHLEEAVLVQESTIHASLTAAARPG